MYEKLPKVTYMRGQVAMLDMLSSPLNTNFKDSVAMLVSIRSFLSEW
jgi:hypothetical protein